MKVKDMKVQDVIEMQEFADNLKRVMNDAEHRRKVAETQLGILRRNGMQAIIDRGLLRSVDMMRGTYAACLNKACKLPASERAAVILLGNKAFNITVSKMLKDERAEENDNGNDQQ